MKDDEPENAAAQLLTHLADGILTLKMNRPKARNALTSEMLEALADQLARAEHNDLVRCVVLTGAGKGFCSGGDVKAMAGPQDTGGIARAPDRAIQRQRDFQRSTAGRLFAMPKPTIAVVNGAAAGAGLALALACDFRIMSSEAILTTAFGRVGLPGDFGGTYFMTQLVGTARARELYFLSDRITAEEALGSGLVNWTCDPGVLEARGQGLARKLASGPPIAFRYMKENLNRAMSGHVDECLDSEAVHHIHCMLTHDHREAAAAFIDKREPVFTGS